MTLDKGDETLRLDSRGKEKHASITKAAKPTRTFFDPWNSSSTGHQRAENCLGGSTSWRHSRTRKLREQFNDTSGGGGMRLADTVGAGSKDFGKDGRTENGGWVRGAPGLRRDGQVSLQESMHREVLLQADTVDTDGLPKAKRRKIENARGVERQVQAGEDPEAAQTLAAPPVSRYSRSTSQKPPETSTPPKHSPRATPSQSRFSQHSSLISTASTVTTDAGYSPTTGPSSKVAAHDRPPPKLDKPSPAPKPIFRGLNFYINGSTYPIVSDHKLKQLIGQYGGFLSLGMARRSITHVIVGETSRNGGAGGGLAASKIQKEAALGSRGEGVKFVKAGWLMECIKQSKRVSEGDFQVEGIGTGGARQRSVLGMMKTDRKEDG